MPVEDYEKIFKALADKNRLQILTLLQSGEKCACVLLEDLHLSQSGLSYHMKQLSGAQLVNSRQVGKWTHYTINKEAWQELIEVIEIFLNE